MSHTSVINSARRAKAQRTAEGKIDEIANAVEHLANCIEAMSKSVSAIEDKVNRLVR